MFNEKAGLDWQIVLDDADWDRLKLTEELKGAVPTAPVTARSRRGSLVYVTLFLVVAVSVTYQSWQRTTAEAAATRAELTEIIGLAAETEQVTRNNATGSLIIHPVSTSRAVPDHSEEEWLYPLLKEHPSHLVATAEAIDIQHDFAIARVVYSRKDDEGIKPLYRQSQFYRYDESKWIVAKPDADDWGESRFMMTPHMRFHFRQGDTNIVQAVAPQIDRFYADLRRTFGLQPGGTNITVEVMAKKMSSARIEFTRSQWYVRVSSPAFLTVPMVFTDVDTLSLNITSALVEQLIREAELKTSVGWEWRHMIDALKRYYVVRQSVPLTSLHAEATAWLYRNRESDIPLHQHEFPDSLDVSCQQYKEAMLFVLVGAVPLQLCPDAERMRSSLLIPQLPQRLRDLAAPNVDWSEPSNRMVYWVQLKALETIIDYVVTHYGREQLRPLFRGFGYDNSWEMLIPVVFGISADEFEFGWQQHLFDQYGLPEAEK
ncbi:hypothetical protein KFU94_05850 [Chloroflexi bacterium TSY]|nr:hypothetical protein [Chloroflexi bacterium TSY]